MNEKKILTMAQLTARVNYTASTIYRLIKAKTFPVGVKIGSARVWTEVEIDEWLKQREAKEVMTA